MMKLIASDTDCPQHPALIPKMPSAGKVIVNSGEVLRVRIQTGSDVLTIDDQRWKSPSDPRQTQCWRTPASPPRFARSTAAAQWSNTLHPPTCTKIAIPSATTHVLSIIPADEVPRQDEDWPGLPVAAAFARRIKVRVDVLGHR